MSVKGTMAICLSMVASIVLGLVIGERIGEKVAYCRGEAQAESNAVEIARLQTEVATMTDRLIALRESLTFTGLASFYSHPFHGRPTASGAIYDKNEMTAASRDLPMGTRWVITRMDTRVSCIVTINDRGPYIDGRIIDLSEAAAIRLGMIDRGVVPVRIMPEGR